MNISNDDYDPTQLIQELSANLNQPDKFAEIFCSAAKTQKKIDNTINDCIRMLLKTDTDARNSIKNIVKEVNREDLKLIVNKIGLAAWSILLLIIGAMTHKYFA